LGYYLAHSVVVDGKTRGVVVAKISLDALQSRIEDFWRHDQELDFVTDENGIVVVSPLSAFALKSIQPIPEAARKTIEASRQYGNEILPISLTPGNVLDEQIRFVDFKDIPGQSFLRKSYSFPDLGLRLYLHLPASRYWEIVAEFTAMFSLVALVIFLVCTSLFQRWVYGAKLIETAVRDPLTGLNTRLYMDDWCEAAIRAHSRNPRSGLGLVVFDLDLFKQVNDIHGHLAGDEVLRRVGEIIRNAIRGEDLAVRFGGEELAVFVHCADPAEAVALAERIRHSVEQSEFRSKAGRIPVTLSGGVAYHAVGETLDALFARADKKLYEAKELGRNRIRD
jgi:diguanylate cyclase (GGDEF)-like protein